MKLREWKQAVLALTPCRGRREDFGVAKVSILQGSELQEQHCNCDRSSKHCCVYLHGEDGWQLDVMLLLGLPFTFAMGARSW